VHSDPGKQLSKSSRKAAITLDGIVEKILSAMLPGEVEKTQIVLQDADALLREIRIENSLRDENGKSIGLKLGDRVKVTIEFENSDNHSD
jgi:uncharacterized protein YfaS (alpha-2-macroglobulin family)